MAAIPWLAGAYVLADTVIKEEAKLLAKITEAIAPGAVFLFHDTSKTTPNVLPAFIQEVKKEDTRLVRWINCYI